MDCIRQLFPKRHVRLPVAALMAALGLAFACSESPTETTLDGMAPLFKPACPGHPSCGEDPPPDPTGITATLTDPAGAGVFSDGGEPYLGDNVTDRFKLVPQCADGRTISLVGVAALPDGLDADQSMCNGGPQGGWVFFRLPDLFDIENDCGPLFGGDPDECFPLIPSFTTNKNGKVRASGAFAPNAQYFVQDTNSGERYEFLFQDGSVDVDLEAGTWHFTANTANLYIGHQFVCEGDNSEGGTENPTACDPFDLAVDITVTR